MAASPAQRGDGGVSPSSSPRLPSPPPSVEVQFGPKSPSISGGVSEFSLDKKPDEGAARRVRPGTKAADMAKGPPFVPLHQLESPFQLQEYLQSLYCKLTRDENTHTIKAVDKKMALELATPPVAQDTGEQVDRNLWLYELCRLLCNKTSRLIVGFFTDQPPCSNQTCPEMRASEWQYLCAVHEPPKSCCAIDYCTHTLDWASNILTSTKHFPSRLSLGGETTNAYQSMRQLTNVFRRVYRIYAHAWFQHREIFWAIESELGLYMFFKTVCDQYSLIPEDNYTIPPEAEGERGEKEELEAAVESPEKTGGVSILRRDAEQTEAGEDQQNNAAQTAGATTRRHKHTPSTGAPIDVIAEGHEDEEDDDETTMLDLGAPGPAQETNTTLSPPKSLAERAKSPGLITIPQNFDPERAPEDPTPIALQDSNPFNSPGLSGGSESAQKDKDSKAEDAAEAVNKDKQNLPDVQEEYMTSASSLSIVKDPETFTSVLGHMQEADKPGAVDSDTETQIATEDAKRSESDEDDELMGKIDASEVMSKSKDDITGKEEEADDPPAYESKETSKASTA